MLVLNAKVVGETEEEHQDVTKNQTEDMETTFSF